MRVVVAGDSGLIGSRTVARLRDHGVEVVHVSRGQGVDLTIGKSLGEALRGADVVVDVSDAPSRTEETGLRSFETATTDLLRAARSAGAEHYVILSVVGAEHLESDYFRAKLLQEDQVRRSTIPHSIVRATPFFESLEAMALTSTQGDDVHAAPVLVRPVSTDDVAARVAHVAVGVPLFGTLEVAGPEEYRLDDLIAKLLTAKDDFRDVVTDTHTGFFGAELGERTLLPETADHVGHGTFAEWLSER